MTVDVKSVQDGQVLEILKQADDTVEVGQAGAGLTRLCISSRDPHQASPAPDYKDFVRVP